MALGYSRKARTFLWPVALAALLIWAAALLRWAGPENHRTDRVETARAMLGEILMAYDDAARQPDLPRWRRLLAMEEGRNRVAELARGLWNSGLITDSLDVDIALACHHFAVDTRDKRWDVSAEGFLAAVRDKERGSYFYHPVDAALHSCALTPEEKMSLAASYAKWPTDWWTAQLAHTFAMDDKVSRDVLQARERRAGTQLLLWYVLMGVMVVTGLLLSWPLWRVWRRSADLMGPRRGDHRRHLRRLWSGAPTLLCFSLAGGFYLALGLGGSFVATWLATLLTGHGSPARWWIIVIVSLLFSAAAFLSWPQVMRWCMAPRLGNLRQVFDLRAADFCRGRWWLIGIAGSALIFDADILLGFLARWLGLSISVTDQLSRTFVDFGALSLPLSILWGSLLAPWTEELVFRGFLFTAFRNQFGFWWGAAASSLLFTVPHFYGWVGTLGVFGYGLLFCFIYQRTQRLASTMILHACINLPLLVLRWLEWSA